MTNHVSSLTCGQGVPLQESPIMALGGIRDALQEILVELRRISGHMGRLAMK